MHTYIHTCKDLSAFGLSPTAAKPFLLLTSFLTTFAPDSQHPQDHGVVLDGDRQSTISYFHCIRWAALSLRFHKGVFGEEGGSWDKAGQLDGTGAGKAGGPLAHHPNTLLLRINRSRNELKVACARVLSPEVQVAP
jgi:hypothetical protein